MSGKKKKYKNETTECEKYQSEEEEKCQICKRVAYVIEATSKDFSDRSVQLQPVNPSKLWTIITQHCTPQEKESVWLHISSICLQSLFRDLYGPEEWKAFVTRAKNYRQRKCQ